jgi:hypothetical protein
VVTPPYPPVPTPVMPPLRIRPAPLPTTYGDKAFNRTGLGVETPLGVVI